MQPRIYLDTETTGMWNFKKDATDPSQPYIVQLAAILETDGIYREYETLVRIPEHVEIDPGAEKTHGISKQDAMEMGADPEFVLLFLSGMISHASVIICHNTSFDLKIIASAYHRNNLRNPAPPFTRINQFCTMVNSTNICKIPGNYGKYKWPKLIEAYRVLVDPEGFEGAHDALADVKACREVHHALLNLPAKKGEPART